MTYTAIKCRTCTSTVPWGPHCPECGAYLEFAGDPPWSPAPEGVQIPGPDDTTIASAAVIVGTAPDAVGQVREVASVRIAEVAPRIPDPDTAGEAQRRGSFAGTLGVLVAGAAVAPLIWWAVGPILGVATAVVFVVWALVLWPRQHALPQPPDEPEAPVGVVEVVEVVEVDTQVIVGQTTEAPAQPEVMARPPQSLVRRTVEATRPMTTKQAEGDVPCPSCSRLNVADRSYCTWCGVPLLDATLAPDTVPVLEAGTPTAASRKQNAPRRGPSRSWYGAIVVLTLLGVLISTIIFSVFGPGAFRVRFGMATVYQTINQFIDPFAGRNAAIDTATATTSLPGTQAADALGGDATSFWASMPSATQGAGNELTFTFTEESTINRMVIFPGIQNRILDTRAVATPRAITLRFDDGSTFSDVLEPLDNEADLQQLVRFPRVTTRTVRLTIDTVYPPRNTPDDVETEVAISGIEFIQPPAPPTILNLPTKLEPRTSLPGTLS